MSDRPPSARTEAAPVMAPAAGGTSEDRIDARGARRRVVIESVQPEIDAGRFPIKRVVGEEVTVEADIFADGHDELGVALRYRHQDDDQWSEVRMEALGNDRWRGSFTVTKLGRYRYTLQGWIDRFGTWRLALGKRVEAGQDVATDLLIGAQIVERAAKRVPSGDAARLRDRARRLRAVARTPQGLEEALDPDLAALMEAHPDRRTATTHDRELAVAVDPVRARFSTWYELFPRSTSRRPGRHATFVDVETRLPYVKAMGFDVLYLPPIHPIGRSFRKGKNNTLDPGRDDPGSPWAIGSGTGGHTAIHPELGTERGFRRLVEKARSMGIETALDIAYQCSPDHPWVRHHPEWFVHRPDGIIQYAENPPKKYQDIYPINFETEDWRALWQALREVVLHWIGQGVRIFRVDNPHTKSFAFWEWMIGTVKARSPDVIFLSEAFTRPKVMYRLAKLGFTQSYTYFTWRTAKWELMEYFTELTSPPVREFFRPNLWPNTPDILTEQLQTGGPAAFASRLILAATLGASYGIYGPPFELMESEPAVPGKEEYLNSEKYEIKTWDLDRPNSLAALIGRVNAIRHENPGLQQDQGLRFHHVDDDMLMAYTKMTPDGSNIILTVVNLDPHNVHAGWVDLGLHDLGIDPTRSFEVHDLLTDTRYQWNGPRNFVQLNPGIVPAHVFRVHRRLPTEQDVESLMR